MSDEKKPTIQDIQKAINDLKTRDIAGTPANARKWDRQINTYLESDEGKAYLRSKGLEPKNEERE